jgi:ribosomal protein S18 acetylase RimI-like enzyme
MNGMDSQGAAVDILEADLGRPDHCDAVVRLVDAYARDPMGDGKPLSTQARRELIVELRKHPTTLIFLAYQRQEAIGVAVCFVGFSTFAARPLVNIHDLAVLPHCRGKGVGRKLLLRVEEEAHRRGYCRLTLEVRDDNKPARHLYKSLGFGPAGREEKHGDFLFLTKAL